MGRMGPRGSQARATAGPEGSLGRIVCGAVEAGNAIEQSRFGFQVRVAVREPSSCSFTHAVT